MCHDITDRTTSNTPEDHNELKVILISFHLLSSPLRTSLIFFSNTFLLLAAAPVLLLPGTPAISLSFSCLSKGTGLSRRGEAGPSSFHRELQGLLGFFYDSINISRKPFLESAFHLPIISDKEELLDTEHCSTLKRLATRAPPVRTFLSSSPHPPPHHPLRLLPSAPDAQMQL
jgi:hypothetical protein